MRSLGWRVLAFVVFGWFAFVACTVEGTGERVDGGASASASSSSGSPVTPVSDASVHFVDASTGNSGPCEPQDKMQAFYACQLYINAWCTRWVRCCSDANPACVPNATNANVTACLQDQTDRGFNCNAYRGFVCPVEVDACTASLPGFDCEQTKTGPTGRTPACVNVFQQIPVQGDGG